MTQKAFERALGISLFLIEEIDKIHVHEGEPKEGEFVVNKAEILKLLRPSNTIKTDTSCLNSPGDNLATKMLGE